MTTVNFLAVSEHVLIVIATSDVAVRNTRGRSERDQLKKGNNFTIYVYILGGNKTLIALMLKLCNLNEISRIFESNRFLQGKQVLVYKEII